MNQVRKIAGKDLTDSELVKLAKELMTRARKIREERYGMTADEAVDTALNQMSEEEVTKSRLQKRNAYLLNAAWARELAKIQENWTDDPVKGLEVLMVGSNIARRGAQQSVDADQKQLSDFFRNGIEADIERTGKRQILASGDLDHDVYKALGELYKDNPVLDGIDRDAVEFARIFHKWQELIRVEANRAGAWIGKLPDYLTHQSHDMFKVATAARQIPGGRRVGNFFNYDEAANFEAWKSYILPRLDEARTFGHIPAEERDSWLRQVFIALASGDHLGAGTSSNSGYTAGKSLAQKLSEDRILHFKDATARFEYDQIFARGGSLYERVGLQLMHAGNNIALMRRFGPNPQETFGRLKKSAALLRQNSVTARNAGKQHMDERILDAYYEELAGTASLPGIDPLSAGLRGMRFLQTTSKLGAAVLASVVDVSVAASELRYQGFSLTDAWKTQLDGIFYGYGARGAERADRMQLASELGVAIDYLRTSTWSRFSAEDALPGWMARGQHFFFQMNGLTWWTDTLRMANAQAMSHRLATFADRALVELPAETQRLLKLFDISAREWDLVRSRGLETVQGKEYLTPKAARDLTDVEIAHLLKEENVNITQRRVSERRHQIESKFRSLFAQRAEYAVIQPGPRTRRFMRGGAHVQSGTAGAEVMRSISQFKGFPGAIIEKVWGREIFGYGESGAFSQVSSTGMGRMAEFMLFSTMLGFMAMYLKAYFRGREIQQPQTKEEYASLMMAAMIQGGGAGLYGDFLIGHSRDRYGQSALEALAGPSIGQASRLFSSWKSIYPTVTGQADPNALGPFFTLTNNMPFINLFYTKAALDYMFLYRAQEWLAPGSLERMEKNLQKNLHQQFKLPPSQNYEIEDMSSGDLGTLLNPF